MSSARPTHDGGRTAESSALHAKLASLDRTIDANRLRSFKQAESRVRARRPVVTTTFAGPAGTTASCASADSSIDPAAMAAALAPQRPSTAGGAAARRTARKVYRRERGKCGRNIRRPVTSLSRRLEHKSYFDPSGRQSRQKKYGGRASPRQRQQQRHRRPVSAAPGASPRSRPRTRSQISPRPGYNGGVRAQNRVQSPMHVMTAIDHRSDTSLSVSSSAFPYSDERAQRQQQFSVPNKHWQRRQRGHQQQPDHGQHGRHAMFGAGSPRYDSKVVYMESLRKTVDQTKTVLVKTIDDLLGNNPTASLPTK